MTNKYRTFLQSISVSAYTVRIIERLVSSQRCFHSLSVEITKPTTLKLLSGNSGNKGIVVLPGFEPGQTEPKPVVLPLHHETIFIENLLNSRYLYLLSILVQLLFLLPKFSVKAWQLGHNNCKFSSVLFLQLPSI